MRGSRCRSRASARRKPRRCSSTVSAVTLKIAARLLASAGPICCSGTIRAMFKPKLITSVIMAIRTGPVVSPRAKKAGVSTFTSTKNGSPSA